MPTRPSRTATDLADRLASFGFAVTPRLVESWRTRGLLGRWTHIHRGGPGSATVPALGAFERARLTARLRESDRDPSTVTLLATAIGAPVSVDDVRASVAQLYAPLLAGLTNDTVAEPADRADDYLSLLTTNRRGSDALRKHASKLAGSADPQRPPFGDRSPVERAYDTYGSILSALAGDSTWITPALTDALRLAELRELVDLLGLDTGAEEVAFGDQVADTLASMVSALANLPALTAEDISAVQSIFTAVDEMAAFAESTDPIPQPGVLVGLTANSVLSQLARPGQLRDGLLAAWNHASLDGDPAGVTDPTSSTSEGARPPAGS